MSKSKCYDQRKWPWCCHPQICRQPPRSDSLICRIKTRYPFLIEVSARRRGRWQSHLTKAIAEARWRASARVCISFSPTGHPVKSVIILVQVPAGVEFVFTTRISSSTSNSKPVKAAVTTSSNFSVGNQGLTPPLHCPGSTLMTLYIYPRTQTGCKSSWWDTHALDIWQFHCQIL